MSSLHYLSNCIKNCCCNVFTHNKTKTQNLIGIHFKNFNKIKSPNNNKQNKKEKQTKNGLIIKSSN